MKTQGKVWIFYDTKKNKKTKPLGLVQAQATVLSFQDSDQSEILVWTPGWEKWVPLDKFLASEQTYFMMIPEVSRVTSVVDENALKEHTSIKDDLTMRTTVYNEDKTLVDAKTEVDGEKTLYTKIINDEKTTSSNQYDYYAPDFRADQIDIKMKAKLKFATHDKKDDDEERRRYDRWNCKIEVTLVSKKGKTFKTFSDNISKGGVLLHDPIPTEFLNSTFNLILAYKFDMNQKPKRIHVDGRVIGDIKEPQHLTFLSMDEATKTAMDEMFTAYHEFQVKNSKKAV